MWQCVTWLSVIQMLRNFKVYLFLKSMYTEWSFSEVYLKFKNLFDRIFCYLYCVRKKNCLNHKNSKLPLQVFKLE